MVHVQYPARLARQTCDFAVALSATPGSVGCAAGRAGTWHRTVLGAAAFVDADPPVNKTVIKRVESAVMKEVAEELGNTPAVARSSYVDPRVVEGYESGLTIAADARRAERRKAPADRQAILESSTAAADPQGGQGLAERGCLPA
jgi:hypothetical protein